MSESSKKGPVPSSAKASKKSASAAVLAEIPQEIQHKLSHNFLAIRREAIDELVLPLTTLAFPSPVTAVTEAKEATAESVAARKKSYLKVLQKFVFLLLKSAKKASAKKAVAATDTVDLSHEASVREDRHKKTWQAIQSGFILGSAIANHSSERFRAKLLESCVSQLENREHRVREAVAASLGTLATLSGVTVYRRVKSDVFRLISENFSRDDSGDASTLQTLEAIRERRRREALIEEHSHAHGHAVEEKTTADASVTDATDEVVTKKPLEVSGGLAAKPKGLKHDTEGWKCLWSAMKSLERLINGLGARFDSELSDDLLEWLERATHHINRFVREVTYMCYAALCKALPWRTLVLPLTAKVPEQIGEFVDPLPLKRTIGVEEVDSETEDDTTDGKSEDTAEVSEEMKKWRSSVGYHLSLVIRKGLGDNWSQVRYASSLAVRNLIGGVPSDKLHLLLPVLLAAMCLNRHYVAAGVRVFSLDTWKQLVASLSLESGAQLVATHIASVVAYYVRQAKADNHAVREAACACIAELALKVEAAAVRTHVPRLLDALIACFKDESWPVRDSACVSLADFVTAFPKRVTGDERLELYTLWFQHLSDNISSVREHSAESLGKVMVAFGEDCVGRCVEYLKEHLADAKKQAADSTMFGELETGTTTFGVAHKRVRDNDAKLHSGQQVYSCGSLAPKLKRATRSGCMDHGFSREREHWEFSDGCVHLLKELCAVKPEAWDQFVITLSQVANIKSFAHFGSLQVTIWKCLPQIGRAVGRMKMKLYLELLLPPMVDTLSCGNQLAEAAAAQCAEYLDALIVHKFFVARLTSEQLRAIYDCKWTTKFPRD